MSLRAWAERHAQTSMGSLGRMAQTPVATSMTMTVIAIALVLPLLLNVLLSNVRSATANWNQSLDISVYMDKRAGAGRVQAVARQLRSRTDVSAVRVITAAEALTQFRGESGFGTALDALSDNPLPDTLVVTPAPAAGTPASMQSLQAAIAAVADVQTVQSDTRWVARLQGIIGILDRFVGLTGTLLGFGIVLVIGNTIRLDILNRRAEIEVLKLVGATDGFTRRPFVYSGIWYGLGGGLLAIVLCLIAVGSLRPPVQRLAGLYGSSFHLAGPGLGRSGGVLALGVALGWIGAWMAATRHIRLMNPD